MAFTTAIITFVVVAFAITIISTTTTTITSAFATALMPPSGFSRRNGGGRLLSKRDALNLQLPNLAPFEWSYRGDWRKDHLDGIHHTEAARKAYIRALFAKGAEASNKCKNESFLLPVYFWPGQAVTLPCRLCREHLLQNGQMKFWRVLRHSVARRLRRIEKIPVDNWEVLSGSAVEYSFRTRGLAMPEWESNRHPSVRRPKMRFYQREGSLRIMTTETSAYGLYTCFDPHDFESPRLQFYYYLIPHLPLLKVEVGDEVSYSHYYPSCYSEWGLNVALECPRGINMRDYTLFDANHPFRFIPASIPSPLPIDVLDDDRGTLLRINTNNAGKHFDYGTNLRVFVHWSEWSRCGGGSGVRKRRTREGLCHVGKIDVNKWGFNASEARNIADKDGSWLIELHNVLGSVEAFHSSGIPLFSGVISELLLRDTSTGCVSVTRRHAREFGSRMIATLLDHMANHTAVAVVEREGRKGEAHEIYSTPCFRRNSSLIRQRNGEWAHTGRTPLLYAHRLQQTEDCEDDAASP